jgi:hypothetical protein
MPEVIEPDRVLDCRSTQFSIRNQIAIKKHAPEFCSWFIR